MTVAQGINKVVSYKVQSALGTAASGGSGQKLRRRTAMFNVPLDTYESDEIVSHQQSTGAGIGGRKPAGKIDGLLSPGTYKDMMAALLRRAFTAVSDMTGLGITIAGSGPTYTVTRATGSFITDGVKAGMVVRLTAGALNAANLNVNLEVLSLVAAVLTVRPLNSASLVAEGPIASSTVSVPGKITYAPVTGHTNLYYTFEQWYADVSKSETFTDCQPAKADIGLPATGNTTFALDVIGLGRTLGTSQVLTSPAAETTTNVLTAVNGVVSINGSTAARITGGSVSIDGSVTHSDMEVGSTVASDTQRGRIKVSGSFTAKFDSTTLQAIKDAGSAASIVFTIAADQTGTADFISLIIPAAKITSDDADDGEKAIVRTYNFVAQYNGSGGSGQTSEQTILEIQDSAA